MSCRLALDGEQPVERPVGAGSGGQETRLGRYGAPWMLLTHRLTA